MTPNKNFFSQPANKILFIAIFVLFMNYCYGQQQNNLQQNNIIINPVVIEKTVYVERYRAINVEESHQKRVARKLPKPILLLGYLWVYPEDIGNFKQQPLSIIANINVQKNYDRDDWRIPTPDELAVLENNAATIGLGDDIYLATDHSNGILRLVSTGKSVAEKKAENNKKLIEGFVVESSQLGIAPFDGIAGTIINTDGSNYRVRSMGGVWWMIQNADKPLLSSQGYTYNSINKGVLGNLYLQSCAEMVCPDGWRLPTDEDFKNLSKWLDANNKWNEWNSGSALGGGVNDGQYFFDQNYAGYWWESSGKTWYVIKNGTTMKTPTKSYNGVSYSVRCIKK